MDDWRYIEDFPGYSVSSTGRVRNDETGRLMALLQNQHGVVNVGLMRKGVQYKRSLALLVCLAYLPAPKLPNFDTPIHLDGDKSNNDVSNLMWRPRWFAIMYQQQFTNGRRGFSSPVQELATGEIFQSSWEAAIKFGLLDREIMTATLNRTYVGPTFQRFRVIDE